MKNLLNTTVLTLFIGLALVMQSCNNDPGLAMLIWK